MPLFSAQQTTHLQRASNGSSAPILRTSDDYAPAPSSGSSLSDLNSIRDNRQSTSTAQAQQYHQPSKRSTVNYDKSNSNSYNNSRNTVAGLLSPRVNSSVIRSVSIDGNIGLPLTQNDIRSDNDQAPQKPRRTTRMRAAESGKGSVLPMRGAPISLFRQQQQIKRTAPGRSNSSGPSYAKGLPRTRQDLGDSNSRSQKSEIRRRTANASSDDEFDSSSQRNRGYGIRRQRQGSAISVSSTGSVGTANNGSNSREHTSPLRWGSGLLCQQQLMKLSRMKLGHLLQVVIVLAVIALVYESHHKALFATQQLTQFKDEESLLLLHLQKIEQQSIQLHENLSRLARAGIGGGNFGGKNTNFDEKVGDKEPTGAEVADGANPGGGREVDFDLIHKQTQQLYQMEQELSHEVETLQKRIQLSARNHLIQEFGEGPVQVVLDLDFGDEMAKTGPHRITILLWLDTPHAAWTWLEQIGNHVWDGAEFKWEQGHIIDAFPPVDRVDPKRDGKIEFVERSQHAHQPWTIGVREQPNYANDSGHTSMSMYINLQDNSQLNKHETCVGKIIDGFDALQQLLESSRNNGNGDQQDKSSSASRITIRKATAMHYVTKKAGM